MSNLFKRKPMTYVKESTSEEVYQQEIYYRLTIVDDAGAMGKDNHYYVMNDLFDAVKNELLETALKHKFGLKYNYLITVSGVGINRIIYVVITKKCRFYNSLFWSCC